MRILLISDHADPLTEIGSKEAGGQNIYVLYLSYFLSRMGVFVDVYTRWDNKDKHEVVKINEHFRVIRVKAGPKMYIPRDNFYCHIDEFVENVLRRIAREKIGYDLIHANYWFSGLIALKIVDKIKIPITYVYHSIGKIRFDILRKYKLQKSQYDFFQIRIDNEKLIAEKINGIISTSPVEKNIIRKLFNASDEKIKVIPIGIDRKVFRPFETDKARRIVGFPENSLIIVYVGRIEWRKGIGTLLYAFKDILNKYADLHLYIIGGGRSKVRKTLEVAELERLNNIAKELNIENKVNFLGPKKQRELYLYYNSANLVVIPSYYEPFGIVPLEAMACGTPVVASMTGGLKFTVDDGVVGYLAEPRNYKDLASKISIVLDKGKEYFSNACRLRVKNKFCWESISKEYYNYFNYLINKSNK